VVFFFKNFFRGRWAKSGKTATNKVNRSMTPRRWLLMKDREAKLDEIFRRAENVRRRQEEKRTRLLAQRRKRIDAGQNREDAR
jgi:hypothetical protein